MTAAAVAGRSGLPPASPRWPPAPSPACAAALTNVLRQALVRVVIAQVVPQLGLDGRGQPATRRALGVDVGHVKLLLHRAFPAASAGVYALGC